jgi:hypothetical protein
LGFVAPRKPPLRAVSELEIASNRGHAPNPMRSRRRRGVTTMINCSVYGGKVGVKIGEGTHLVSKGLRVAGAEVGVENDGVFEHTDTVIK